MAAESSDGLGGPPGDARRNLTDDTWYQLVSSLRKPCAACLRPHGRISPRPWPIPFHEYCECEQLEVPPVPRPRSSSATPAAWPAAMPVGGHGLGCPARRCAQLADPVGGAGVVVGPVRRERGSPRFDDVVRRKGLTPSSSAGRAWPRAWPGGRSGWGRWGSGRLPAAPGMVNAR